LCRCGFVNTISFISKYSVLMYVFFSKKLLLNQGASSNPWGSYNQGKTIIIIIIIIIISYTIQIFIV